MKRVVLAGGSGFLGHVLARHFVAKGDDVVVLIRRPSAGLVDARGVTWDGHSLGNWWRVLDGADVLINYKEQDFVEVINHVVGVVAR